MSETETPITPASTETAYERCDHCAAPVDAAQRYCVVCGSRNKRADDPVARYLARATSRLRAAEAPRSGRAARRRTAGLGTAVAIAVIPLAVAVGVIVGRANSGGYAKVIAAAEARKAPIVKMIGGGASTPVATVASQPVTSTFSLSRGYAVELLTLPVHGTDQAAVSKSERAATAQGAAAVGVIDANDFSIAPRPAGVVYVLYSGQYRTRPEAAAALAKLKRHFPRALVIAVRASAQPSSSSSSGSSGQVKVKATKTQLAQGAGEVKRISHATGKGYVQAQNSLPGQVSVP